MLEIDDKYYIEACDFTPFKKHNFAQWGLLAACLVLTVGTVFSFFSGFFHHDIIRPEAPNTAVEEKPNSETERQEIHINMANIHFNELSPLSIDSALCYKFPIDFYSRAEWDQKTAADYYGRDFTPLYTPSGLIPAQRNGTTTVLFDPDGKVVHDITALNFYHDYSEDGLPKLTEIFAHKGIHIEYSKTGLIRDCLYLLPENEVKTSLIGSTPVSFGYRAMPHGPYDPETHEPSGCYDLYVCEFELDGIEFFMLAEQIEDPEELVKLASSIILGENVILDR